MAINVELFDGTILEFPDGTDKEVMLATGRRMTLERQMQSTREPRRNDLGEIQPTGSQAYEDISKLVDPLMPYASPVIDYFTKPKTSSVLEGTTLDTSGENRLPPSTDPKRRTFEAASPEERIALAKKDVGFKNLQDFYTAKDKALAEPQFEGYEIPDTRKLIDTRAEKRRERMIASGVAPETATNVAKYAAQEGMAGASPLGIARPLTEDELAAENARQEYSPDAAGTLSRIGGKSKEQYKAAVYGGLRFFGDMAEELGAEDFGQRLAGGAGERQKRSESILRGIGENPDKALNFLESGVSGAINNIAPFLAGPKVGLSVLASQVFGQEYGQGRDGGLGKGEAVARASAMTTAEIIGEAASLPTPLFMAFKKIADRVPVDQIMPEFGRFLIKENLAEQVTNALQFSTDKFAVFGLRPDASFQDYLNSAYETFYQTMAQTLVTGGGAVAAGKAIRLGDKPTQAQFDAQEQLRNFNRAPVQEETEEEPVIETPPAPETKQEKLVVADDESQDRRAMLAELEDASDQENQLKQVTVDETTKTQAQINQERQAAKKVEADARSIFYVLSDEERLDLQDYLQGVLDIRGEINRNNINQDLLEKLDTSAVMALPKLLKDNPEAVLLALTPTQSKQPATQATVKEAPEAPALKLTEAEEKAAPADSVPVKAIPKDEFLLKLADPDLAGELQAMAANAGWAQVGGKLLRENMEDQLSPVIGRTTWIPKEAWWQGRPKGMNEAKTNAAVRKAIAGEKLNMPEKRMIEYMINVAEGNLAGAVEERARLEESDRQLAQIDQQNRTEEALAIAKQLEDLGQTGAANAIVKGIQEGQVVTPAAITFLRGKVQELSQPAPMELTGQTADEARAEAAALEEQQAEAQRTAAAQEKADKAARERTEITQRSEAAADDFQLGQTAEDNLTGQQSVFDEPVEETNVPLGDFQNGIIMGMNGENSKSGLISEEALRILKDNQLVSEDANGKMSLLPKGKSLSNAMYQAKNLTVDERKELFAKFIPGITVEAKVKPTEKDPDADIPFAKSTMEQQKAADTVAKQEGGKVVWQDGDYSLIESVNGAGKTIYKGANKTTYPRFQIDIADFKGDWIPADVVKVMRVEADKLRKADDKKSKNPFVKFTDGIAYSESVEKNVANVTRQWKKLLNITNNVYITTFDDVVKNFDSFSGPQLGIRRTLRTSDNLNGVMIPLGNGDYVIAFKPNTSKTRMLEVIAHELGHVHEKVVFNSAPKETQDAIKEEYAKWLESQKGKTARELLNSLRALQLSKSTNIRDEKMMADSVEDYWKTFSEWYADQVSRWSTTSDKPLSVVDQFFSKIAETLRKFYTSLKGKGYLPNETFKKYLDDTSANLMIIPEVADVGEQLSLFAKSEMKERDQVNTPEFKKFFGDSKVVDEDGKPLVVYHGTTSFDGNEFKPSKKINRANNIDGYYFTTDREEASSYSLGEDRDTITEGSQVIPAYLSLQNPFVRGSKVTQKMLDVYQEEVEKSNTQLGERAADYARSKVAIMKERGDSGRSYAPAIFPNISFPTAAMQRVLEAGGYDGFQDGGNHWVAFKPTQIKSATGNIGAFSTDEGDITLAPRRVRTSRELLHEQILDAKISEQRGLSQRKSAIDRRFRKGKSKKGDMQRFKILGDAIDDLKADIADMKIKDVSPERFLANAAASLANKKDGITKEVLDVINAIYDKNPKLLDGISLTVKKTEGPAAGQYDSTSRTVNLYKGSEGMTDPMVIRHEITHSLEQMMSVEAKLLLVDAWGKALVKASKADKTEAGKLFFDKVIEFTEKPSKEAFYAALKIIPKDINGNVDLEYYQFISPSEYWAVNAEPLMKAYLGSSWEKFKNYVRALFEALKDTFGFDNKNLFHKTFKQIVQGGQRESDAMLNSYITAVELAFAPSKNVFGGPASLATWKSPEDSKLDNWLYKIQDKLIDTKRVQQAIEEEVGELEDNWNAYMKEELYHGRTAKRTQDFLKDELLPIVKELVKNNIEVTEFETFLHNRHAEERNISNAKRNPSMPDGGSGILTADAKQYLADLDPAKRQIYEKLANKIDAIVKKSHKILVDGGDEEQSTIDIWEKTYKHYVPLERDELDFVNESSGLGQGFSTRGNFSARSVGSAKNVIDIFANIALQRERAIIRVEKMRIGRALMGLAIKNPDPDFWIVVNPDAIKSKAKLAQELIDLGLSPEDAKNIAQEPKSPYTDPITGLVSYRINPRLRNSDNVFPVRVNGKDRFIFFRSSNERAMRMVSALKNLNVGELEDGLAIVANVTRWLASVNTQYNPVFGIINFSRDLQGAALNLTSTKIADKKKEVIAGTFPALRAIYNTLRSEDKQTGDWANLWEDFQKEGAQTGYRDQFSRSRKQASIIERETDKLNRGRVKRYAYAVAQWLSDYNDALENAVRLSAYKVALDKGLSKQQAASIAKNLTVNFNRKGTWAQTTGALYAFFNAAVQGTTRLVQTMKGPAGRKIFYGGVALGALQAVGLAMAGFDEDDPPEFIKSRNLIFPTGGKTYISIPMPLGFNVFPNLGRLTTEFVLSGGKNPAKKSLEIASMIFNTFNPVGGSGLQLFAPTILDPLVALETNVDPFGRPISKKDRVTAPTPGYLRSREESSTVSKYIAEFLNYASGGTQYQKGEFSPTADQIDYLAGQATGGLGREVMKTAGLAKSLTTGEEVPPYKVPIIGKFYGNAESPANIASKFYDNVTQLANYENEIKGRQKNRENVGEFLREHPEARMYQRANRLENEISQMNKRKKELLERKAPKAQIDALDKRKTMLMDKFNKDYKQATN